MTEPVKRDSPSKSGRGQARTRLARRAVVDAARTLFLERGYAATTIEAISEHSDVPPATVYRLFSSKLGILKALLDTSIAGDDQPLAVQERPDVASLFTEPDPQQAPRRVRRCHDGDQPEDQRRLPRPRRARPVPIPRRRNFSTRSDNSAIKVKAGSHAHLLAPARSSPDCENATPPT